ncbi:hypothetical protein Trydic_g1171 [Trypoxylus dichotomus]
MKHVLLHQYQLSTVRFGDELLEYTSELEVNITTIQKPVLRFEDFSSLTHLKRVVAYSHRFISNCTLIARERQVGLLTPIELRQAMESLVKRNPNKCFHEEIIIFQKKRITHGKNVLQSSTPFIDSNGLLRAAGRFQLANFEYDNIL